LSPGLQPAAPLLLGHRGARLYAPENTFPAFDLALVHGCHGFEFDVRLTGDSIPIVCHDPKIAGSIVATSTLAHLRKLADIATLEDVLARYAASSDASVAAVLDIELKVEGLELLTIEALRRHPPQRSYWVSSFLPHVLVRMHQLDAQVPLGLICDRPSQLTCWPTLPATAMFLHSRLLAPALVRNLQSAGKQVFAWTINQPRRMRTLAALGIDGIISDDTQLLTQTLG
jgi:glycerophosphoryl diester phosphodiesterase